MKSFSFLCAWIGFGIKPRKKWCRLLQILNSLWELFTSDAGARLNCIWTTRIAVQARCFFCFSNKHIWSVCLKPASLKRLRATSSLPSVGLTEQLMCAAVMHRFLQSIYDSNENTLLDAYICSGYFPVTQIIGHFQSCYWISGFLFHDV